MGVSTDCRSRNIPPVDKGGRLYWLLAYYKGYEKGYRWLAEWRGSWACEKRCGASMTSLGTPPSQHLHMFLFTSLKALQTSYLRDFHGDLITYDQLLTQSPVPFSSPEDEYGTENSKFLIIVWPFWWSAPTQQSSKNCLVRTKDILITQTIPKDLGVPSKESGKRPTIRAKNTPGNNIIWESIKVCARNWGWRPNIYIF